MLFIGQKKGHCAWQRGGKKTVKEPGGHTAKQLVEPLLFYAYNYLFYLSKQVPEISSCRLGAPVTIPSRLVSRLFPE
jgi:hypothetical protein